MAFRPGRRDGRRFGGTALLDPWWTHHPDAGQDGQEDRDGGLAIGHAHRIASSGWNGCGSRVAL